MNKNKTYCINMSCPFKDCDKHLIQLKDIKYDGSEKKYVNVASLDSICEDYLGYLVDEIGLVYSIKNDF